MKDIIKLTREKKKLESQQAAVEKRLRKIRSGIKWHEAALRYERRILAHTSREQFYRRLVALNEQGKSFLEIGIMYGHSSQWAKDKINEIKRRILWEQECSPKELVTLDSPIHHLELSVRPTMAFLNADIQTIGQLCAKTEKELIKYRNVGTQCLFEIVKKLQENGFKLSKKETLK